MKYIPIVIVIVIGFVTLFILRKMNKNKKMDQIISCIQGHNLAAVLTKATKAPYDFMFETEEKKYLFKVIFHPSQAEINVNSKNYWQVNHGVVSSRKQGVQLKGIYGLVNYEEVSRKPIQKIYIITPNAKVLMKVVNECEMVFITPETDCFGVNIYRHSDLDHLRL